MTLKQSSTSATKNKTLLFDSIDGIPLKIILVTKEI